MFYSLSSLPQQNDFKLMLMGTTLNNKIILQSMAKSNSQYYPKNVQLCHYCIIDGDRV